MTSEATTAKPLPASPARAASMVAFSARRLVWLAIALISVTAFGYTGYLANTLAFPADVFPRSKVASVWGLASMGSGFGGMLFMALSGWLIGRYGYTPVFIGYGILPLIALAIVLFLIGPLRPHLRFQMTTESSL